MNDEQLKRIDIVLAENVMGWEYLEVGYFENGAGERQYELSSWMQKVGLGTVGAYFIDVPEDFFILVDDFTPSTDANDALKVVDKFCEEGVDTDIFITSKRISVRLQGVEDGVNVSVGYAEAETAPLALCLAMLQPLGLSLKDLE
jgi:hypothetical protein